MFAGGGHVARSAASMLFAQLKFGVLCSMAITSGALPMMWHQPDLAEQWEPLMVSPERRKDKLGNNFNASPELEFEGTRGCLVGEEGRAIPVVMEFILNTRFDVSLLPGPKAALLLGPRLPHSIRTRSSSAASPIAEPEEARPVRGPSAGLLPTAARVPACAYRRQDCSQPRNSNSIH